MSSADPTPTAPDTAVLDACCPRCGGGFECGADLGPAGHCACFDLRLTEAVRAAVAARYPGECLCVPCLRALSEAEAAPVHRPAG
jgi:hypothetical protein